MKDLPEGYILWRHVKRDPEGSQKSSHAAAGHQRSDVYLYGHPGGKTKRFRSPDEFLPHLYWLVSDKAGNPENCKCKRCGNQKDATEGEDEASIPIKKVDVAATPKRE